MPTRGRTRDDDGEHDPDRKGPSDLEEASIRRDAQFTLGVQDKACY